VDRLRRGAERARADAEWQLELLLNGTAQVEGKTIDYIIRAPIDGTVITLDLKVGEPVVPSSSYGSGTVLAILADLDHPIFRGTVDEIDVGRLREGMTGALTVGALPGESLFCNLTEISLKARESNNAIVFNVELEVMVPASFVMRSGYSAVARIVIEESQDTLVLPERLIEFHNGKAFVLQSDGQGGTQEVEVEIGLSDGMMAEIQAGLEEGSVVVERQF
jgi:HlyD family secretion protein